MSKSKISGFSRLTFEQRVQQLSKYLGDKDLSLITSSVDNKYLSEKGNLTENFLYCKNRVPVRIITNAHINGKDYLIPAEIEEPSIVAAASKAFKYARPEKGGMISAESVEEYVINGEKIQGQYTRGQVSLMDVPNIDEAVKKISEHEDVLLQLTDNVSNHIKAKKVVCEPITIKNDYLQVYLLVDTGDAQGANRISEMCKIVGPCLEEITGGTFVSRVVSNYTTENLVTTTAIIPFEYFTNEFAIKKFLALNELKQDPYRGATDLKGSLNGLTAVMRATGQDDRAVYSAIDFYAHRRSEYEPVINWKINDKHVIGRTTLPMPVGIIGGDTCQEYNRLALDILGVESRQEFQQVLASVAIMNNLAAMNMVANEDIGKHMKLHYQKYFS